MSRKKSTPPTKPKRGAPTKRNPEVIGRILKALKVGVTLEQAATYGGISYDTLNEWRKAFPDFAEACKKARATMEVDSLRVISAAGRRSWQARAWMLERLFPEKYGRRMMIGGAGSPIQIESELRAAGSIRSNKGATKQLHDAIATAVAGASSTNGKASSNGQH
jgi:hypothetical protein